jgi:ribosomal protein S21
MSEPLSGSNDNPYVTIFDGDVESAHRRLRRKVSKAGVLRTLRDRREGVTRSGRRRIKADRARQRHFRRVKRQERASARDGN